MAPGGNIGMDGRLPSLHIVLGWNEPRSAMWKVPKRTKNTVKPFMTSGPKLGKIRYKTNSGYRLNVLIQDFTACGLWDMPGPCVNWIANIKRHVGSPWLTNQKSTTIFHSKGFLRTWNTFFCGNQVVSGGLVLSPTLYLTLAEVGLRVNGGLLFLWKNATLVLTWNSESGDLGIRVWRKLLPVGDNSLPSGRSDPRSGSSPPLLQDPWSTGPAEWGSHPTGVGSKGWHKSEGSALRLDEASRPRKSWLRRCLLWETNRSLNPSLLNFCIFYVLSPWFINFRIWSKLLNFVIC